MWLFPGWPSGWAGWRSGAVSLIGSGKGKVREKSESQQKVSLVVSWPVLAMVHNLPWC